MMFGKISEWLRYRLRKVFPVPPPEDCHLGDFLSTVQKEAVETNRLASIENADASRGVSEAVRQTLEAMGARRNET